MKVLLLGEYSGFYTNLKKGLLKHDVQVTLASTGDGWKKIEGSDYILYKNRGRNVFESYYNVIVSPYLNRKDLFGYDIVQIVGPSIYPGSINKSIIKDIIDHSGKSFISVAGNCASLYNSYKEGLLGYYTYDDNPEAYERYIGNSYKVRRLINQENFLYNYVDGIIPIMYEYAVGVRNRKNTMPTIPLPMDCSHIEYVPNVADKKIVISHGVIKEKFKGTSYIVEAMNIIKDRYPNDVEIRIGGKMPLKDYLQWLGETNILIDQCKEHCYGMNALYGMAMGKIVLGGASKNSLNEFNLKSSPIHHIEPNVNMIVDSLESLISERKRYEEMGAQARSFVESFHDCSKIAEKYINTWKSI